MGLVPGGTFIRKYEQLISINNKLDDLSLTVKTL